ncbi:MAG: cation:proton antiporter [Gemmatimonadota bacterium]|nr:cation:proton antiporter [Gemmatimonadota bacterium]
MDPLLASLVLISLALVGARLSFSTDRVPQGPRLIFRTGTHFLFVGFALGPGGLGLLSSDATHQLFPLLATGLGWVGFHFGLQLDRESLKHFPLRHHVLGAGQAVTTFVIFLAAGAGVLAFLGFSDRVSLLLLVSAAAIAAITTPAGIAMVSSNFIARGKVRDLLFFVSSLDAGIGIFFLQVAYALFRPEAMAVGGEAVPQISVVGVALGLGAVLGIVFVWLNRGRARGEELVLYLLGMCAFSAGAALQLGLSPLFVSMVMGAVVANMAPDRQRIHRILQRWEKPVYLIFLLLAGALLSFPTAWVFPLAVLYTVLRGLAKVAATAVLVDLVRLEFPVPRRLGLGLIPQGGIPLAMAVSGVLMYSDLTVAGVDAETTLFAVIVLGVVMSELAGPFLTGKVLRRAGELAPGVEAALARGDERRAEREAVKHRARPREIP